MAADLTGPSATIRTIRVTVTAELVDIVTDRMWQWGVQAVSEVDTDDGRVILTTSVGNDHDAVGRAVSTLEPAWPCEIVDVPATVSDDWKRFARPVWFRDDMVCVPAWRRDHGGDTDAHVTVIDPGSAFGLGDHPTTRTSMALLADVVTAHRMSSVLDVGCGTGVLAILAAQLGVATVRGIDIADAAVEATLHNAALNGVSATVDVDTTPIHAIPSTYDLVVANILAPVLIAMADDLVRLVGAHGHLIVGGLLADRHDHVLTALRPLAPVASRIVDGWITIHLRRHNT